MIYIPHPIFLFMCCCVSPSYLIHIELLSILECEHMWHANGGDLHTTIPLFLFSTDLITPSPVFKISFSLPRRDWLQHLKICFVTQLSLFHWFFSWHLEWKVPEDHADSWTTASPSLTMEPASPCNLQAKECAHEDGKRVIPSEWEQTWALARCWEQQCVGVVSDPLISANCFFSNILLFYPHGDLLMLKIWVGRWSLPCCW